MTDASPVGSGFGTAAVAAPETIDLWKSALERDGALVIADFFSLDVVQRVVEQSLAAQVDAFYADGTHNVYLTDPDPSAGPDHPANRQVTSSKGLLADDQIPADSPLRALYDDHRFRSVLCQILGVGAIHPYADSLSSINVHFAPPGCELGWHFDNSSFAVTMLLQAPERGGRFEYVPDVRSAEGPDEAEHQRIAAVLDGRTIARVLDFGPGDLVLFRGRDALHRVTPTEGSATRMLVVFAFNEAPDVRLSASALSVFYGRTG